MRLENAAMTSTTLLRTCRMPLWACAPVSNLLRRMETWAAWYENSPDAKAKELITYLRALYLPDWGSAEPPDANPVRILLATDGRQRGESACRSIAIGWPSTEGITELSGP
jgi:hypothetical protein